MGSVMSRIQLSENFYLDEFTRSQTASRFDIDNSIDIDSVEYENIKRLVTEVLQPIRDNLGAVHVLSGYRCPKLNKKIDGSRNSQHMQALAADIRVSGHTPYEVAKWCAKNLKKYDQLIYEFGEWVHVSIPADGKPCRFQALTAVKQRVLGRLKTAYARGILTVETAIKRVF